MAWTYLKLMRELDRWRLPRRAQDELLRRGAEAYDYLIEQLGSGGLSALQTVNTLVMLGQLRPHTDKIGQQLYELCLDLTESEDDRVASRALSSAAHMTEMESRYPGSEQIKPDLHRLTKLIEKRKVEGRLTNELKGYFDGFIERMAKTRE